ncbi:hypothetical protein ACEPPN_011071 [Leptodophora sp. 'Broadleaf-Isolate-01']
MNSERENWSKTIIGGERLGDFRDSQGGEKAGSIMGHTMPMSKTLSDCLDMPPELSLGVPSVETITNDNEEGESGYVPPPQNPKPGGTNPTPPKVAGNVASARAARSFSIAVPPSTASSNTLPAPSSTTSSTTSIWNN